MFQVPTRRSPVHLLVLLAALLVPSAAWAETAKITLKTGEVSEAEVVQLEFGKQVTVRGADGAEKTILWADIANLEMNQTPAAVAPTPTPAPAASAETQAVVAAAPAAAPAEKAAPSTSTESFQRLQIVEKEIDELKDDRAGLGGPIAMMATGYPLAALFFASGVSVTNLCSFGDCSGAAAAYFTMGGLSLASGVIGTVWLVANIKARGLTNGEIEELEEERDRLRVDVQTSREGAYGTLTLSF